MEPEYTEKDKKIEDLEIRQENFIDALKRLKEALNSVKDYDNEDVTYSIKDAISSTEYEIEQLNDQLEELKNTDIWDNDYDERMSEYRRMQGF